MEDKVEKQTEKEWSQAIKIWNQNHQQVYHLVLPVFVNLILTLVAWIYVYEMRVEKSPVSLMFFDSSNNLTTGNDFYDGMLNGFVCVASVAVLSFVMLAFALYDFRFLIQCWLSLSCLLIMFCVSGTFLSQLFAKLEMENPIIVAVLTLVYGTIGIFAFFTNKLSLKFHQFYVICNCSLVSLFYLQILPNHTTWFLLAGIVVWDIFAVLTPLGPLRRVTEKAQDYSEDILRFLMFSTKVENTIIEEEKTITKFHQENNEIVEVLHHKEEFEETVEWEIVDNSSDESQLSNQEEFERQVAGADISSSQSETDLDQATAYKKTAQDALNDSSARLGMGDFVFYSLLVGKAAVSGSILATTGAIIGVIIGLIITLTVLSNGDETTPALPVSIFLGMSLHFGILYLAEPMIQRVLLI